MISSPLFELLICSSGFIAIFVLVISIWIISYIFFGYVWFRFFIINPQFTNLRKFRLSIRNYLSVLRDDRYIGNMWFIKQSQWHILIISLIVIVIGCIRACYIGKPAELELTGVFVTVAGLLSAWLGLLETGRIETSWGNLISSFAEDEADLYKKVSKIVSSKTKAAESASTISSTLLLEREKYLLIDKMQKPLSDAQKRVGLYSLIISIIGTLVCAYGDQLPVEGIAKYFEINTSKVVCECQKIKS